MSEVQTQSSVSTPCAHIDDGYTMEIGIDEVPGIHQSLHGQYRPMTPREVKNMLAAQERAMKATPPAGKTKEDMETLAANEAIAKHIVNWTLVDREGKSIQINAEAIDRIYPTSLQNKLIRKVMGLVDHNATAELVLEVMLTKNLGSEDRIERISEIIRRSAQNEVVDNQKN